MATANYGWPVPSSSAPPNVPVDTKALADAADATVKGIDTRTAALESAAPRGIIKRGKRITESAGAANSTPVAVMRVDNIPLVAGRSYVITTGTLHVTSTSSSDTIRAELRYSTVGTATTASAILEGAQSFTDFGSTAQLDVIYTPATNQTVSLLLCVARFAGAGTTTIYADGTRIIQIRVHDDGIDPGNSGVNLP